MNGFWLAAALVGLVAFLYGLARAAWSGQDSSGRWLAGGARWLLLAAVGLALLLAGLRFAGAADIGLRYPQDDGSSGGQADA